MTNDVWTDMSADRKTCAIVCLMDSLDDLGYKGAIKDVDSLTKAIEGGIGSADFTKLISWLSGELKILCGFEEQIHPLDGTEDEGAFLMEVSSFIREMSCPYPTLTDGPISQRLATAGARTELINYLITELQAARMTVGLKKQTSVESGAGKVQLAESSTASHLKAACIALGLPKPPDTITSQQLFSKLTDKVKEQLSKLPKEQVGHPLFIGGLNPQQWEMLEKLNENMKLDYRTRAELLIQRLDVTVQSFTWSDRVKKQEDELLRVYRPLRQILRTTSGVTMAEVLAARSDLTHVEKTASSKLRAGTKTTLNKLLIQNRPPDRGGRPTEIQAPPPEMPPWQKRVAGGRGGGGHYGGHPQGQRQAGGRGSGRVQGGGWQGGGDRGGRGGGGGGGGRQDNYNRGYQQQQHYGGGQGQYDDGGYHQQYQHQHSYQPQQQHYQQPFQHQQSFPGYYQQGGHNQSKDQYYGGGGGGRGGYQHRGGGGGGRGGRGGGGRGQW